ncbi:MAG: DUF262 domain-containing protein [Chloroflexi bacterium]|nr:DUF262 domain-containing protein [Chloroflexota bacterium]
MPTSYMDAHTQGIGELIQHMRFFSVPDHQRDFAWTDDEVEQFLDDVIAALQTEAEDYFLGLIVLVEPQQGEVTEILDGQQRLATTTMVYAAIREWLHGAGYEQDANKLQDDFVGSRELGETEAIPRLTLNVNNRSAFHNFVVDRHNDEFLASRKEAAPRFSSERRLIEAAIVCRSRIARLAAESGEEPKDQARQLFNLAMYLRDRVKIVVMNVASTANAYVIFESLNDRGLDLSVMDLVKNHLFARSGGRVTGGRLEEVQSNWINMLSNIAGKQSDDFLKVFWTSRWGRIQRGKLFHEWRRHYDGLTPEKVVTLSSDLAQASERFSALEVPDHEVWSPYSQRCKRLVKTLSMLGSRQTWPVMLAALEKFDPVEMERLLEHLVTLTVRYQLVGRGRTGLLEIASARVAHGVFQGGLNSPHKAWKEYSQIVPSDKDFLIDFARWSETKSVKARYVLAELEKAEYQRSHAGAEPEEIPPWEELTLEHILPVNPGSDWSVEISANPQLREEYIARLGNLCLLQGKINKDSSAKSFAYKRNQYAKSDLTLTSEVSQKYKEWNSGSIEARQQELAQLALLAWPLPAV